MTLLMTQPNRQAEWQPDHDDGSSWNMAAAPYRIAFAAAGLGIRLIWLANSGDQAERA